MTSKYAIHYIADNFITIVYLISVIIYQF